MEFGLTARNRRSSRNKMAEAAKDDEKERSLYIVVGFCSRSPFSAAIYELKIGREGKIVGLEGEEKVNPLRKLFDKKEHDNGGWMSDVACDALGSEELYLFAHQHRYGPVLSVKFNRKTKVVHSLPSSIAYKQFPLAIAVEEKEQIYLVSNLRSEQSQPIELFHCKSSSWQVLDNAPFHCQPISAALSGYVVAENHIIVSLEYYGVGEGDGVKFFSYNLEDSGVWKPVSTMKNNIMEYYFPFNGKAIVVGNFIYTYHTLDYVYAYKLGLRDGVFVLRPPVLLEGVEIQKPPYRSYEFPTTESIAHVGDGILCLLCTGFNFNYPPGIQPFSITMIRLCDHPNAEILYSTMLNFGINDIERAHLSGCFVQDYEEDEARASGAGFEEDGGVNDVEKIKHDEKDGIRISG